MAEDRRQGRKTPAHTDREKVAGTKLDAATYIGVVKDNYDPTRSGRLQVWIPDFGGTQDEKSGNNPAFWRTVSYASPYFGATYQPSKYEKNSFDTVNHTYGMWMIPPDIGNQVLCTFVNGDPGRGYWFACINPTLSHGMVPGIATNPKADTTTVDDYLKPSLDPNGPKPQVLPVVEFNENAPDAISDNFYNNPRPIHEWQANVLLRQGLDIDGIRGAISSSSQRETPSHVFGISTPGRAYGNDPADDPEYQQKVNQGLIDDNTYAVRARKGGHQFVMDDGDSTGKDQLIRLRTSSGHQILMNDYEKIVYIANSEGSVWIELAGSGHMHIFTASGFNLHTQGDMNLHSGKNVNIHAENNVNLFATNEFNVNASKINATASDSILAFGGKVNIGSGSFMNIGASTINMGAGGAIQINGSKIDLNKTSGGNTITGASIQQNTHNATGFISDPNVTPRNVWREQIAAAQSIVSVLPQHEPWTRQGAGIQVTGDAPLTVVNSSICPPKKGAPPSYTLPPPNNAADRGKVKGQPYPWSTDKPFLDKVKSISETLNLNYIDMLACMNLETGGTFDPAITNSLGYTGLIQFGADACRACGTTTNAIKDLTRQDQCDFVLKYFQVNQLNQKAPTPRLVDIYLTILWPAAVGKPDDYVVFQPNSAAQRANSGFDTDKKGYTTVADVAAKIKQNQDSVKQLLANAGEQSQTLPENKEVSDGTGNVLSSTGSTTISNVDTGITQASAKSLQGDTCPAEYLNKSDNYSPPGGIGDTSPQFSQLQVKAMMSELGYLESKWDYAKVANDTVIGKYQIDAFYLTDTARAYIKPDAYKQYSDSAVIYNESWTGKDKINSEETFFEYKSTQDQIQFDEFTTNYAALIANGGIKNTDDICTAAGMLFVAHYYRDVDKAKKWRDQGGDDTAANYFNHGRYSIDILAANGAVTPTVGSGLASENTSGINPDDVLVFTSGSGDRSHFDQLDGSFKSAMLRLAQDYKNKTGSKVTITSAYRSQTEQTAIYDKWQAAGGKKPENPSAAGITTPALPVVYGGKLNAHGQGIAIDSSQAQILNSTFTISDYGLSWGGNYSPADPVHIYLSTYQPK
jgi:hypothetical protein